MNVFPSKFLSDNRKSKIGNLKSVGLSVLAFVLAIGGAVAEAQQPAKIPRIGFLAATSPNTISARTEAFQQGVRELGYVEGKNIVIEYRWAEGKFDRVPALAAELVQLKVEVIVTAGPTDTRFAKQATTTIPIVMGFDNDPVRNGFVATLAQPGGNVTGLATLAPELSGKRLELLKEIIPKLSRVAVFGTSTEPGSATALKETEAGAAALRVQLHHFDMLDSKDIEIGFREASKRHVDAVLTLNSPVFNFQRTQLADLAVKNRLPVAYGMPDYVEAGGLMAYGPSITDMFRRAAIYVDKILKGAKPADLPVEQARKFEFVINLKAAKQIGLTIPPNVLARADRVIK